MIAEFKQENSTLKQKIVTPCLIGTPRQAFISLNWELMTILFHVDPICPNKYDAFNKIASRRAIKTRKAQTQRDHPSETRHRKAVSCHDQHSSFCQLTIMLQGITNAHTIFGLFLGKQCGVNLSVWSQTTYPSWLRY